MSDSIRNLLAEAVDLEERGRPSVACLLVGARGSTPQVKGAMMLVDDTGRLYGTIGGGCVEAEVRREAMGALTRRGTRDGSGLFRFKLDHDYGWDDGLICGGTVEVAVGPPPPVTVLRAVLDAINDRSSTSIDLTVSTDDGPARYRRHIPSRERLLIAGAGHIGAALAEMAMRLDFDVHVFDDRRDQLERIDVAGVRGVHGPIDACLREAPVDDATYGVVVTRGHRNDGEALAALLGRGLRFIGMIGSRRKAKVIRDELLARGFAPEALDRVATPVGLDIGAETVPEIAVAIAAQLVEERRKRTPKLVEGPLSAVASGRA